MSCFASTKIALGNTYKVDNIGPGLGIYAQDTTTGTITTFELKSIVAGNNIVLASDNESITISSEGVDTINNNGGGSEVGQNIVGDTINLRTLVGTGGTNLVQNPANIVINSPTSANIGVGQPILNGLVGNQYQFRGLVPGPGILLSPSPTDVTIITGMIQSANNSIVYNYGQTTSINLAPSYSSFVPIISNIGSLDQDSGSVTQTGPTTIDYTPSPRNRSAAFFTFTTTTSAGVTNNSIVRMSPDLRYADDKTQDYMLASGSNGLLYQISPNIAAENLMLNYDGTPVGLVNLSTIAFSIADNLLFYTQLTATNIIRVYDFTTKADSLFINATSVSGWSGGAVICDLCFCQASNTLYAKGDTSASRLLAVTIRPYDHIPPVRYDNIITHAQPFALTGGINFSIFVTDNDDPYFAVRPSIGNTQVSISNKIGAGGTTGFSASTIPEANTTTKKLVMASSGTLYCYSITGNAFYRIVPGGSIGNGFVLVKNLTRSYASFSRSPLGIAVI